MSSAPRPSRLSGRSPGDRRTNASSSTPAATLATSPCQQFTADDIRRLLRRLDHQPATRRNLFAALSYLFRKSLKDEVISKSPLTGIDPPSPVPERVRSLLDVELQWLWSAVSHEAPCYRGIVEDLILTGQRRSEVAGLPWSELSRERREWHLPARRAKNDCENIIPLTDTMIERFDKSAGGEKLPKLGLVRPSRNNTAVSGFLKPKRRLDKRIWSSRRKQAQRWNRGPSTICGAPSRRICSVSVFNMRLSSTC